MKKYFNNIICAVLAVIVLMLVAACGSSKKQVRPSTASGDAMEIPAEEAYRIMTGSYAPWQSVSMPVKLELVHPKSFSISGRITMEYGKALSISLRFFGMEVAQLYADNDSLIVFSKMKDVAYTESIRQVTDRFGFTLADLQCLLLGQMFVPGQGRAVVKDAGKFRFEEAGAQGWAAWLKKTPSNSSMVFVNNYPGVLTEQPAETTAFIIGMPNDDYAGTRYDDFTISDAGAIAGKTTIEVNLGNKEVEARLVYQPGKARWNEDTELTAPKIPAGINRVTTESLLKILSSL